MGRFRYPCATIKHALVITALLVGACVISDREEPEATTTGRQDRTVAIAAATYDVLALTAATSLGVFKPGRPFRRQPKSG